MKPSTVGRVSHGTLFSNKQWEQHLRVGLSKGICLKVRQRRTETEPDAWNPRLKVMKPANRPHSARQNTVMS